MEVPLTSPDTASSAWWTWPAYLLFFLMLAFPAMEHFLYAKECLVALLLIVVVIQGVTRSHLHREVAMWALCLAAVGLLFGLRGLFLNAPGASSQIRVYVLWPLIYLVLLGGINLRILQGLEKTLVVATGFVGIYLVYFFLSELGVFPKFTHLDWFLSREELNNGQYSSISLEEGHVEMYAMAIGALPFLVPFLMAALVSRRPGTGGTWVSRRWLFVALLLSLPMVILSGRRALQLVSMLAPVLTLILGLFQPRTERLFLLRSLGRVTTTLVVVLVLLVPLLGSAHEITFQGLAERFKTGFDFSASNRSDSAVGRVDQYLALTAGWKENPFIGKGLGAAAHTSVRANEVPWGYELSYVDLLFQTGLLGFLAYTAGIIWIYWLGIKIIKRGGIGGQFMLPALVGMSALLIANATNPYLRSFDTLWPIFLPLAFINYWLHARECSQEPS